MTITKPALNLLQLGRLSYIKGLDIQKHFERLHLDSMSLKPNSHGKNMLLVVEHNPVYTIGLRTKNYSVKDEKKLRTLGAEFYKTNRGGLITFHGPGQLVVYPVINLKHFKLGMRNYIELLEKIVIQTCKSYGVEAQTTEDTGIWVKDRKICALGVHGRRFITTHGLALNCNTDLTWFDHIVPCGIKEKGVTSLSSETNSTVTIADVLPNLVDSFARNLNCNIIPFDSGTEHLLSTNREGGTLDV